jgi:hypothetical protein
MKYILNFTKFAKKAINEMFDDEDLKSNNEVDYLSGNFNKKKITTPVKYRTNELNRMITKTMPFYKKGNPDVNPDYVAYYFGNETERLVIMINGEVLKDELDNDSFRIFFYIEKNNKCLNPDDKGEVYTERELLEILDATIPSIEAGFKIKPTYSELN